MTSKALVIGYGSIGERHVRVLGELGIETAVVSRRDAAHDTVYPSIIEALRADDWNYAVIASRTSEHAGDLTALAENGFAGHVLVEKPLFVSPGDIPANRFADIRVAYNLRFHPGILSLKEHLAATRVQAVSAYAGSYLPDWRPGRDHRETASASSTEGGGVLRDLSHEIDYLLWLFGPWKRLAAIGGMFGDLGIDADDSYTVIFEAERTPSATLQLNYLDRTARRDVTVMTDAGSFQLDLVAGTLETPAGTETFSVSRDVTYRAEHEAMLRGDGSVLCGVEEGLEVMRFIAATETAQSSATWVSR